MSLKHHSTQFRPSHTIPFCQSQLTQFSFNPHRSPDPHRPRLLLLNALDGCHSHTTHVAPAVLAELEKYPVYTIDLPGLYADSAVRSCEEACVQV
jgi:hypothetical protein